MSSLLTKLGIIYIQLPQEKKGQSQQQKENQRKKSSLKTTKMSKKTQF